MTQDTTSGNVAGPVLAVTERFSFMQCHLSGLSSGYLGWSASGQL